MELLAGVLPGLLANVGRGAAILQRLGFPGRESSCWTSCWCGNSTGFTACFTAPNPIRIIVGGAETEGASVERRK